jgi:hypothetical protein
MDTDILFLNDIIVSVSPCEYSQYCVAHTGYKGYARQTESVNTRWAFSFGEYNIELV